MKVGVLGFAHGHVGSYCREWRSHPEMGVEVTAGWDHDEARARGAEEHHGIELHDSPDALVTDADVEAVVIAAETSMHAELVEKAATAGKAVILQKPMALTVTEADRIVAAVSASDVPFTMAWQMRVDPENLKMKDLLEGGEFGRVFMVRRRHGLATQHMRDFESSWHVDPELNRDIWADDAAHPVDFIYWLFGMPASVTAELATLLNPRIPNDNGVALFRYPGGMIAEVSCSFVCVGHENTTEIVAERGVIIQNYGDGPSTHAPRPEGGISLKWYLHGKGAWEIGESAGFRGQGERIANLAGPLAEFLDGKRPAIATAEDGRDTLRMVLACYESSEAGRRVALG